MKKIIEIISLTPNYDMLTQTTKNGLLLKYKENNSTTINQVELNAGQKQILDTFQVENFNDVAGKKAEVDIETKDGKMVITSFAYINDRPITYEDVDLIKKSMAHIIQEIESFKSFIPGMSKQNNNQNNNQNKQ